MNLYKGSHQNKNGKFSFKQKIVRAGGGVNRFGKFPKIVPLFILAKSDVQTSTAVGYCHGVSCVSYVLGGWLFKPAFNPILRPIS